MNKLNVNFLQETEFTKFGNETIGDFYMSPGMFDVIFKYVDGIRKDKVTLLVAYGTQSAYGSIMHNGQDYLLFNTFPESFFKVIVSDKCWYKIEPNPTRKHKIGSLYADTRTPRIILKCIENEETNPTKNRYVLMLGKKTMYSSVKGVYNFTTPRAWYLITEIPLTNEIDWL